MAGQLEALQDLLNAGEAFGNQAHDPRTVASLQRIPSALATPAKGDGPAPVRLPVCDHLAQAADPQRFADPSLRRLAAAFLCLELLLGGSFHNPPGILHAMRAADMPLFAFWAYGQGSLANSDASADWHRRAGGAATSNGALSLLTRCLLAVLSVE